MSLASFFGVDSLLILFQISPSGKPVMDDYKSLVNPGVCTQIAWVLEKRNPCLTSCSDFALKAIHLPQRETLPSLDIFVRSRLSLPSTSITSSSFIHGPRSYSLCQTLPLPLLSPTHPKTNHKIPLHPFPNCPSHRLTSVSPITSSLPTSTALHS